MRGDEEKRPVTGRDRIDLTDAINAAQFPVHTPADSSVTKFDTAGDVTLWQDIATAPKDGTQIDVWVRPTNITGGGYGRVSDCWFSGEKWWLYDETKYASDPANCRSEVWNVTHWMPRPAAPTPNKPLTEEGKQ
jgi:hypothetical protein